MPIGFILHPQDERDEIEITAGAPDDLQRDRQTAIVEAGGKGQRRKSQHIHETRVAAQFIELARAE